MTCTHDFHWFSSPATETGWRCLVCDLKPGEPPGYSPELDRSHTDAKVMGLLLDLTLITELVSVSNGSHGESICAAVVRRCHETKRYDQQSIVFFLADQCAGDGNYWLEIGEGVMAGKDPRERCRCGKLSMSTTWRDGVTLYRCSECSMADAEREFEERGEEAGAF